MSLQELKSEADTLSPTERKELIGHLLSLGRQRSPDYWDKIASKIEDPDPANWVTQDQLDRVLHLDSPES